MPLEQTVTIVNNSGKIISTGKQLLSVFKEAKTSYKEKKAQIKAERSLRRAQTFDQARSVQARPDTYKYADYYNPGFVEAPDHNYYDDYQENEYGNDKPSPRRRSYDGHSEAPSRRSRGTHKSTHRRHSTERKSTKARSIALTEKNLKALSEASSKPQSGTVPTQYRSPYAETLPMDQSRMDLTYVGTRSFAPPDRRMSALAPRRRSEGELQVSRKAKEIDMNLAYGNVPPDLEFRLDLDPLYQEEQRRLRAEALVRHVESLLDEAHCVQHSATSMIKHLQSNPESAAAVALTLGELSKIISKMSPVFLKLLQGGSPAVFSLLASPQFLIGTGVAVGVTVVMFGGWKIMKQIKDTNAAREAWAYQGVTGNRPAPLRTQSEHATSYDEALIVDEELSTIESWRRGIEPLQENESADLELITPEADRATRAEAEDNGEEEFDLKSRRSTKTHRTSKTAKTSTSHKTSRTQKTNKTERMHKTHKSKLNDDEIPKRKSSHSIAASVKQGPKSEAARSVSGRNGSRMRFIEDGSSRRARDDLDLVMRPKTQRKENDLLKTLFRNKKRDAAHSARSEMVLA